MTTLPDRPNTALLVIDVQNGIMAQTLNRDAVLATIAGLVERARAEDAPVVWVQHANDEFPRGSESWQFVPELDVREADALVHKCYGDSFEDTDLEAVLADRGVGRLIVTGAQSDACVRSTLHGALVRGYDTTLVADAHTTEDLSEWGAPPPDVVIAFTNLYWGDTAAPGRQAGTVDAADVSFAAQST
ncbi:MAG TPA: isochorismatase family protein [Acidimicrobiales bacterium]